MTVSDSEGRAPTLHRGFAWMFVSSVRTDVRN